VAVSAYFYTMHGFFLQPCLKNCCRVTLWIWLTAAALPAWSQQVDASAKLSPGLLQAMKLLKPQAEMTCRVYLVPGQATDTGLLSPFSPKQVPASGTYCVVDIRATALALRTQILPARDVVFVERARIPNTELFVGSMDLSLNGVRKAQRAFPRFRGDGQVISVKEDRPDSNDLDIRGRLLPSPLPSARVDGHATLMSTIMAGAGNSWILGRGVAPGALLSPADFANLLPDPAGYYTGDDIRIQNHSYGVGVESYYGADAAAYDASANDLPMLLHVFSAGNRGNAAAETGVYQGLPGFANLTGSFKMSKNTVSVGALDSFGRAESLSSRGPAHDGRVKPELVAFGEDGSSGAAALVSGTVSLLQQAYSEQTGQPAPNALLRNLLINTAADLGPPAVDYVHGYGSLDAHAALQAMQEGNYLDDTISALSVTSHFIQVPAGVAQLKIALTWNDPPAAPNAARALVHDLDLRVVGPAGGQTWLPWVLSSFPHPDSLRRPAVRAQDSLNNIEQVTIDLPGAGTYEISVRAGSLGSPQPYFISWQWVPQEGFSWLFPVQGDYLEPGKATILRWKTALRDGVSIESSMDSGRSWTTAFASPDLPAGFTRWTVPDHRGIILLRARSSSAEYPTDSIVVSPLPEPVVGFSCADSVYLSWQPVEGATAYRLFRMSPKYLELASETPDSFAVIARSGFPGDLVALAPVFGNAGGLPSYTFNHSDQGVGCYFRSFRAEADQQAARLFLSIGTLFRVRTITLEKWSAGQFIPIAVKDLPDSLDYQFTDAPMTAGINRYRVRITFSDGRTEFSNTEDLFYGGPAGFRVYPNVVRQGEPVQVYLADLPNEGYMQVIDAQGRLARQTVINDIPARIATAGLPSGMYIIRIVDNDRQVHTGRFIVLQ
jgi:hypothetical protein